MPRPGPWATVLLGLRCLAVQPVPAPVACRPHVVRVAACPEVAGPCSRTAWPEDSGHLVRVVAQHAVEQSINPRPDPGQRTSPQSPATLSLFTQIAMLYTLCTELATFSYGHTACQCGGRCVPRLPRGSCYGPVCIWRPRPGAAPHRPWSPTRDAPAAGHKDQATGRPGRCTWRSARAMEPIRQHSQPSSSEPASAQNSLSRTWRKGACLQSALHNWSRYHYSLLVRAKMKLHAGY
jgi:hypothetical protein